MDRPEFTDTPRLVAKAMLKHDRVREAELLLLPERVVRLNTSGAAILRLCDGNRSVREMIDRLERDFDATDLATDVLAFLGDAHERGWVELR